MQASIQPIFTWSKERIFAGGAQSIALLVEWKGVTAIEESQKRSRKVVAREIELRIWFEPHVKFTQSYGCNVEAGEGRSLLLKLGKLQSGQRNYVVLEFALAAMPAGRYEALWLQWQYKQRQGERIRELPVQKLGLEYTHHTSVLEDSNSFYVEKHMELLKTKKVLEDAVELRKKGQLLPAHEHLRRHADKLLLLAVRSGDHLLLKEAEILYRQSEFVLHRDDIAVGQISYRMGLM
ncbi:hypothetical protein [Paenibacillus monticola]|uniref:Uncharacterized protein n=1 Tax=Paenibacillus monticola TaxID=2666075 RepID=A0A7X2KZT3_9BACL|nr:hypothetical protein [Paenibacillus monticola]MRN51564.1 hypothetical protein [Paenibacillus monticola]